MGNRSDWLKKLRYGKEGQYFERKRPEVKPVDVARLICAFANAEGGEFVIGIGDDGRVFGVTEERENEFRKVPMQFFSVAPDYRLEVLPCEADGGMTKLMLFTVEPSYDGGVMLSDGTVYKRYGDSTKQLSHEQIQALEYAEGYRSFEKLIAEGAKPDDLDDRAVSSYIESVGYSCGTMNEILKARNLLREADGEWKVTNAGVLVLGRRPTQFLPGARVRFLRYDGVEALTGQSMNLIKDVTFEGPLARVIEEAKREISSQLREFQWLGKDGRFIKVPEYPGFAWLEGLVNAVTHRDYSMQGEYIRVTMYDDRLEFLSPGRLPRTVTVENIRSNRYSRNPCIARALNDYGYVRELNEGVRRIYQDMADMFLDPPEYSEPNGAAVKLVLRNNIAMRSLRSIEHAKRIVTAEVWNSLDGQQKKAVCFLVNAGRGRLPELEMALERSRPSVKKILGSLVDIGVVVEHSMSARDPNKYFTVG